MHESVKLIVDEAFALLKEAGEDAQRRLMDHADENEFSHRIYVQGYAQGRRVVETHARIVLEQIVKGLKIEVRKNDPDEEGL